MNIGKMIAEELGSLVGGKKKCDYEVLKTVKMKPEWKKRFDEFKKLDDQADKKFEKMLEEAIVIKEKVSEAKKRFWRYVEVELDDFRNMQVTDDGKSIEIIECKDHD
jgi:uncharacterized protein (DUF342 family)